MSIIGPRDYHDCRNRNFLSAGCHLIPKQHQKKTRKEGRRWGKKRENRQKGPPYKVVALGDENPVDAGPGQAAGARPVHGACMGGSRESGVGLHAPVNTPQAWALSSACRTARVGWCRAWVGESVRNGPKMKMDVEARIIQVTPETTPKTMVLPIAIPNTRFQFTVDTSSCAMATKTSLPEAAGTQSR